MKKIFLFFSWLLPAIFFYSDISAQPHAIAVTPGYFKMIRNDFKGENAFKTVEYMEPLWRLAGNTGYNKTIYYVKDILEKAGFKKEMPGAPYQPLTYRVLEYPMDELAWDPIDASLYIEGDTEPVLSYKTNKNMLAIYSGSTPAGGVDAEVVYIDKLSEKKLDSIDVKGKIVFAETYIGSLYGMAIKHGAIGVLSYSMPAYNQPEKLTDGVKFESLPYSTNPRWGILLNYKVKEKLKALLARGKTKVHVFIETKTFPSKSYTLVANVNGKLKPEERFVISAHVQEPGANDNASGVATALEMARTTAGLIRMKKFIPQRTMTFVWGDEIVAIERYIREDSVRRKNIKWGISLDMVGENTSKTGGTFLIEKIPDPSAIWTRGEEKHSEWGGGQMRESDMFPNWFNDFVINRCLEQSAFNGWVVKTNPFEGGSDHTPFISAGIPGLLMWHFTDVNYHTSLDRLDMVSAGEMKNVGVSALVAAFTLINANEITTTQLINEIEGNALKRLDIEYELSKKSIGQKGVVDKEKHILDVWGKFYSRAIDTMKEICVNGTSVRISNAIAAAKKTIEDRAVRLIEQLE